MRLKLIALLVGAAIAAPVGTAAIAAPDDHGKAATKRAQAFHGTVLDADGDDDPLTAGPLVVTVTKANGNARRAGMTGDVTVTLTEGTRFYGAADDVSDVVEGDSVKVTAKKDSAGAVAAKKVKEKKPA